MVRSIARNGEHYLARTRREFIEILRAGSGAGAITASTVVLKFAILWLKLPVLMEAALFGLNYAGSFLLMQSLGFRLATKQPALLAATLARRRFTRPMQSQIIAIARSQLAATLGNFALVVFSGILFHFSYLFFKGKAFLTGGAAGHALESLDPFRPLNLTFAALTGGLLWLASLVSGWTTDLGRQLRHSHSLKTSSPSLFALVAPLSRQAGGIGFNLSLAFFLCSFPLLGRLLGVSLDVRHFTLSSGTLALSLCTLGLKAVGTATVIRTCLGIILIGALNFGVSFILSLVAALSVLITRQPYPRFSRISGEPQTAL